MVIKFVFITTRIEDWMGELHSSSTKESEPLDYPDLDNADLLLLKHLIPFQITLPPGWHSYDHQRKEDGFYQRFRPPEFSWSALLKLMVFQYHPELDEPPIRLDPVPRVERLKRSMSYNLVKRNAIKDKEKIGTLYSVPSHECWYHRSIFKYGYAAIFIVDNCEFVFLWELSNPFVYRKWLPDVEKIVKSIKFNEKNEMSHV
jgi:hypothetical protein